MLTLVAGTESYDKPFDKKMFQWEKNSLLHFAIAEPELNFRI